MNYRIVFKNDYLEHHGVKGQKWGIRNGPPYPLKNNGPLFLKTNNLNNSLKLNSEKSNNELRTDSSNITISGHHTTPSTYEPNSTIDSLEDDGSVDKRTHYGDNGKIDYEIHTNDHNRPAEHPYGKNGEHIHEYEWNEDGSLKNRTIRDLTDDERKEHEDILK